MINFNKIKVGDIIRFCNKDDKRDIKNLDEVDYYGIIVQKVKARNEVSIRWLNHKYMDFEYEQSYEINGTSWSIIDTTNEIG